MLSATAFTGVVSGPRSASARRWVGLIVRRYVWRLAPRNQEERRRMRLQGLVMRPGGESGQRLWYYIGAKVAVFGIV